MLSFFRRFINSKVGVIITFVVLGVIALAFAAGDVTGLRTTGMGGMSANDVASVGKTGITAAQVRSRTQTEMEGFRQQQPTLDMAQFIAGGGLEGTLQRLITGLAFEQFGAAQDMVVSARSVDGQIASIPALQGPTGTFDPQRYQRILAERKLTDAGIRADIARDTIAQQLTAPSMGATQVPVELALPYGSLLLEKRAGEVGLIPTRAIRPGAPPTEAELTNYYKHNVARYTVPQRRIIRYASVSAEQVKTRATPTDAEIAQAYQASHAKFAAAEKRTIAQVVVADQAGANAIAAKVKGGVSVANAAHAAGLEASTQTSVIQSAYATISSPQIADAAFAAGRGAVIGPIRGPLGWTVARVESVVHDPGKTLAQARKEIVADVIKLKTLETLRAIHDAIDDSLSKNGTFDEIAAEQKLAAVTTAPLVANGINPDAPGSKADPALTQIVAAGYAIQEGDAPQMVQTAADGSFALVGLGRIVPAAPRPMAQVHNIVIADFTNDRSSQTARLIAGEVVAKVNKGATLKQALGQSGLPLPATQPLAAARAQLAANPRGVPAPLALLFSMASGTAKLLEAPSQSGWFIIKLDRIEPGNAVGNAGIVKATRSNIGRGVGREYVEEFAKAVRADVGVKTDAAALGRVRAELLGKGSSNTN